MAVKHPDEPPNVGAPLIILFERDDAIAVPLLSHLRLAGYDVRSARTPLELFDILDKNLVALLLVDLGTATAGRREFWVALDAQRRGRDIQVLTFRYTPPASDLNLDLQPSVRAIADVEIYGPHEFQKIIDAVRQRLSYEIIAGPTGVNSIDDVPQELDRRYPRPDLSPIFAQHMLHINDMPVPQHPHRQASMDTTLATVFISYSRKDHRFAQRVVKDLQVAKINVWLDQDRLVPGTADWEREIRHAITSSTGVIYVASEDAVASQYVRDEMVIARDNLVPVYPIWVRGAVWSSCIPLGWGHVQYADARGDKYDSAIRDIIAQLIKANGAT